MAFLGHRNQDDLVFQLNDRDLKLGNAPNPTFGNVAASGGFFETLTVTSGATLPAFESLFVKESGNSSLGEVVQGLWHGSGIEEAYGGTGQSSYNVGDILVADGTTSLTTLASGVEGSHLKIVGGALTWTPDPVPSSFADGDLIVGVSPDSLTTLASGAEGSHLVINGGALAWVKDPVPTGLSDGDILIGSSPDSLTPLASGAEGQVLSVTGGALAWRTEPHPLSFAVGDILVADSPTSTASLPSGAEGTQLKISGGALAWVADPLPSSFSDNDILLGVGPDGLTTLASGAEGTHLKISGGAVAWVPDPLPSSFNDGDLLVGVSPDSLTTLPSGSEGQELAIVGGALAWRNPPADTPQLVVTAVAQYNASNDDDYIMASGQVVVALPSGAAIGQAHVVKDVAGIGSTSGITVSGVGGELIDGAATFNFVNDYQAANFVWNGAYWSAF